MKKTARMVSDDDPQWLRFWTAFPLRVSKKDARAAWAAISPDIALVDRMIAALDWQVPRWEQQGYGACYPATWLRGERWDDERPRITGTKHVPASSDPWWWASCPHTPKCGSFRECNELKRESVAS